MIDKEVAQGVIDNLELESESYNQGTYGFETVFMINDEPYNDDYFYMQFEDDEEEPEED